MTREDAAKLLEIFRSERPESAKLNTGDLARAYLIVLGSLEK